MGEASEEFATDPCSSMKRGAMVRAARALLSAVTRLLILADMVDVHLLLKSLRVVSILFLACLFRRKGRDIIVIARASSSSCKNF